MTSGALSNELRKPMESKVIEQSSYVFLRVLMNLSSKSKQTYTYRSRRMDYLYLSKACIVLNGINKSFLHRELIKL